MKNDIEKLADEIRKLREELEKRPFIFSPPVIIPVYPQPQLPTYPVLPAPWHPQPTWFYDPFQPHRDTITCVSQ